MDSLGLCRTILKAKKAENLPRRTPPAAKCVVSTSKTKDTLHTGASEVPEAPEVTIAPCPFPCIPFLGVLTFLLPSGSAQWPAHRCRLRTLLCWVVPAMARCEPALLFLLPPFVLRRDPACGW
eukprot:s1579_g34.t1